MYSVCQLQHNFPVTMLLLKCQLNFLSESLPEWQMRNNNQHNRQRRGYQSPRSGEGHSDHVASEKQDRWRIKCKGYRVQSSPSPESVQRRVYRGTACATANVNTNGVVHQSAPAPAPRKPPFVAYGCQYRDRETGHKKTHNVLAASEVSYTLDVTAHLFTPVPCTDFVYQFIHLYMKLLTQMINLSIYF